MERKINLLFIVYKIVANGVTNALEVIINNLDKSKYNAEILILCKSEYNLYVNTEVKYLYESEYLYWNCIINNNVSYIVENKYDIVISYSCVLTTKYMLDCKLDSKKISFMHAHYDIVHKGWTKEYIKEIYSKIDKIVCVSKSLKDILIENIGYEYSLKCEVIHNPIDENKIKILANEDIAKERFTVVCVARLGKEKGIKRLIRVHKMLLDNNIEHNLVIIGDGELRRELETMIINLEIEKTCILKGYMKNPHPYTKNSDLVVLLSDSEGFSLSIMEAMVLAKPIVCTNVCGNIDVLDGKYGKLTDIDDESIYLSMKEMILDNELRESYVKILESVKSFKFSKDKIIKDIDKLIYELLNTK